MLGVRTSVGSRNDLHIFSRGVLTVLRYRNEILAHYVLSFIVTIGRNSFFMDDNAQFLRASTLTAIQFPFKFLKDYISIYFLHFF